MPSLRESLRALPSIVGVPLPFDLHDAPENPRDLTVEWLLAAIDAGVTEPHAATLSTVDADGWPDARVLILKDVTENGAFEIATTLGSAKGLQLQNNPRCALSFHWASLARAVRIRGVAERADPATAAADFAARHPDARALVLAGAQGSIIDDAAEHERSLAEARRLVASEPDTGSSDWSVWRIAPVSVEFWQGDPSRDHLRLRYDLGADGWEHRRLSA